MSTIETIQHVRDIDPDYPACTVLLKGRITAVKTLYTSIVEPHFQDCCSVLGCCNVAEIQHLQKFQNRAARIVINSSFDTAITPIFESLGWKTIQQLIDAHSKTVTFQSL